MTMTASPRVLGGAPGLDDGWIPEGTGCELLDELRDAHLEDLAAWQEAHAARAAAADQADARLVDYRRTVSAAIARDQIVPDPPPELDPVRAEAVRAAHDLLVAQAAHRLLRRVTATAAAFTSRRGELADFERRAEWDRAPGLSHISRDLAIRVVHLANSAESRVIGGRSAVSMVASARAGLAADLRGGDLAGGEG